jgi:hypothetical protein
MHAAVTGNFNTCRDQQQRLHPSIPKPSIKSSDIDLIPQVTPASKKRQQAAGLSTRIPDASRKPRHTTTQPTSRSKPLQSPTLKKKQQLEFRVKRDARHKPFSSFTVPISWETRCSRSNTLTPLSNILVSGTPISEVLKALLRPPKFGGAIGPLCDGLFLCHDRLSV